jgi:hypothetical protein
MFHLSMPAGEWHIGQPIRLADGRHGRLAELAADGAAIEALAVLSLEAGGESEATSIAVQAAEVPLPYPLG